ncbi:MAG: hypothetical protein U9P79_07785 [Candidatus Cloacimonadota bacterium]|nr:hypothetical protein [Candidatus Cloacimonadota bacterium]
MKKIFSYIILALIIINFAFFVINAFAESITVGTMYVGTKGWVDENGDPYCPHDLATINCYAPIAEI